MSDRRIITPTPMGLGEAQQLQLYTLQTTAAANETTRIKNLLDAARLAKELGEPALRDRLVKLVIDGLGPEKEIEVDASDRGESDVIAYATIPKRR